MRWTADNREAYKKKNPEMSPKELMSLLGKEWNEQSNTVKKKYEDLFAKDKKRYEEELKVYTDKYGPIKNKKKELDNGEKKGKKTKKSKEKGSAKKKEKD
jgi:hypothetical protein